MRFRRGTVCGSRDRAPAFSCAPVPLGRLCVACCRGQSCWRRVQAEKVVLTMRRHRAAACLQSYRRMFVARRSFLSMKGDWLFLSKRRVCLKPVVGAYETPGDRSQRTWLCRWLCIPCRLMGLGSLLHWSPAASYQFAKHASLDRPILSLSGGNGLQVLILPKRFLGVPSR